MAPLTIAYSDMVWLPNILDLKPFGYEFVCVDEAQDLNQAQLELVLKAQREGGRGIFVGDRHQAIMGFSAADHRSIDNIIERTGAMRLPLSICYRCPTSHIGLANKIHPVIQPKPNAIPGEVREIDKRDIPKLASPKDLVICRCFYPLVDTYFDLLSAGIPSKVRNRDIGTQLLNTLSLIDMDSSREYSTTEFTNFLGQWYNTQKMEMLKAGTEIIAIANLHDKVQSLNAIYKGSNSSNVGELIQFINRMCDTTSQAVLLTTIHGAKGLEADRVFLLMPQLLPHPKAELEWELEQEFNLEFVALTRAKHSLIFAR